MGHVVVLRILRITELRRFGPGPAVAWPSQEAVVVKTDPGGRGLPEGRFLVDLLDHGAWVGARYETGRLRVLCADALNYTARG